MTKPSVYLVENMRFCVNCKYAAARSTDFVRCYHPQVAESPEYDMATGIKRQPFKWAIHVRQPDGACTPEAKLFEERPKNWFERTFKL